MAGSLILVNPQASRARNADTLAALTERAMEVLGRRDGVQPRLVETGSSDEVGPLVREAVTGGVASVVGVGGDGTLREIAVSLAGTETPLGIVPAGTGNQVAGALGIPGSPAKAIDALARATAHPIDLGDVTIDGDRGQSASTFLIGCGAGFDAELMATTSARSKRRLGVAAYFLQGAKLLLRLSATPCRVTVDGRVVETDVTSALVGNMGHLIPGRLGLRLPLDPTDGALDLIVVDGSNVVRGARGLLETLTRTELGGDAGDRSIRLRGEHISIEPLAPLELEVDGDHVGGGRLDARVRPAALRVLVPDR